ncbi:MAG TPA: PAS domain-containing protein [Ramlibacter sp.]|nr:PAS domain-containing protein [Ramlibacter sp.]
MSDSADLPSPSSSAERLDFVVEACGIGIWLNPLPLGKLLWNHNVKAHFHLPPDADVDIDLFYARLHPDDRERVRREIEETLAQGRPFASTFRTVGPEGAVKWIRAVGRPGFDAQGVPTHFDGITLDVSELKVTEERLRASRERFVGFANSAPAILWVTDPSNGCIFLSRGWHAFTGQPEGQGLDFKWLEMVHPEDRAGLKARLLEAAALQERFELEHRLRRADGSYGWVIDAGQPHFSPAGAYLGYVGSVTDIHARKLAEQSLLEADRRKDEFIATLAHELRNPLAPIRNAVELMRMDGVQDADLARSRDVIDKQVSHLTRLIDDLLDISRITRDRLQLKKEPVAVAAILRDAIDNSRPDLEAGKHPLQLELPADDLWVEGDAVRLVQMVMNLLTNAAKYSPAGRPITLTAAAQGQQALIRVRDSGHGIAAEHLPRVFDMFFQANRGPERGKGGLGIGLSLVQRLAQLHGGSVQAYSAGPEQGSEFVLRLPLSPARAAAAGAGAAPLPAAQPGQQVLVVDDNRDSADTLAEVLRIMGWRAVTAYDGQDGLEKAQALRPDAVVLDLGMPRLNGYDACRQLREQPWGRGMVVVAVSGWGQKEDRRRSKEAGFDAHLVKPVSPAALVQALQATPQQRAFSPAPPQ